MLTPDEIRKRSLNHYEDFLRALCREEQFFPLSIYGSGMTRVNDYGKAMHDIAQLRKHSKENTGFGYAVEWKLQTFRRYSIQEIPARVSFATQHDFTRFLGKCSEAKQFETDYGMIISTFPELAPWAQNKPLRIVEHALDWEGLLVVCKYLQQNGRPNCYLRELPVPVDTKFIERKRGILNELLAVVAPNCAGSDESSFESRFGFRQKQPLVRLRVLDPKAARSSGIPFSDLAVPVEDVSGFSLTIANAIVVENEMTFLTLPPLTNTLAFLGAGDAVSLLRKISWLDRIRLLYWGDTDAHGFEALSLLRERFPHVESVMMDSETFARFSKFTVRAGQFSSRSELRLTASERELFNRVVTENLLLEQERISVAYASECLRLRFASPPPT